MKIPKKYLFWYSRKEHRAKGALDYMKKIIVMAIVVSSFIFSYYGEARNITRWAIDLGTAYQYSVGGAKANTIYIGGVPSKKTYPVSDKGIGVSWQYTMPFLLELDSKRMPIMGMSFTTDISYILSNDSNLLEMRESFDLTIMAITIQLGLGFAWFEKPLTVSQLSKTYDPSGLSSYMGLIYNNLMFGQNTFIQLSWSNYLNEPWERISIRVGVAELF